MPTPSVPFQTPFGGRTSRYPFWDRASTSVHSHSINITQAQPAKFLPRIKEDAVRQLPVVLYPGTIVGVLNKTTHNAALSAFLTKPNVIVPAYGHASGYNIVYSADDASHERFGSVYDVDGDGSTLVSAAGTSTKAVLPVMPLGVVQEPVWDQALFAQRQNFQAQHKINLLARGRVLRIPCMTAEEVLIEPGNLVMVSNTAGDHDPRNPATSYPGRWKKFDDTAASVPYIVGRCIQKHRICSGTATTVLSADLTAGTSLTNINEDEQYHTLKRVQTTSGLNLQGSGTQGMMAALTFARSDGSGDYWAIDVALGVVGI